MESGVVPAQKKAVYMHSKGVVRVFFRDNTFKVLQQHLHQLSVCNRASK